MSEIIDVFDEKFNILGKDSRDNIHKNGLWHQTFLCWIVKDYSKIILQLRSKNKSNNPNLLDVSCSGHIMSGETLKDGVREIKEELGLLIDFDDLKCAGYFKWVNDKIKKGIPYKNREFCNIFICKSNISLSEYILQEEEVDGIFEMDIENGKKLFSDKIEKIKLDGFLRSKNNSLEKNKKIVKIEDFTKDKNFWLKTFTLIEDFLNNKKELTFDFNN